MAGLLAAITAAALVGASAAGLPHASDDASMKATRMAEGGSVAANCGVLFALVGVPVGGVASGYYFSRRRRR
jgi:hypothetical protein